MIKNIFLLILIIFPILSFSKEKFIFDEELCFYEDEKTSNPARFVYYNKNTGDYIFSFVEENEKERILEKTKNNAIKKNNIKYSIGKKIVSTFYVDYFEICLHKNQ